MVEISDPKKYKPKPLDNDPAFSEDVCLIDEKGLIGIASLPLKRIDGYFILTQ